MARIDYGAISGNTVDGLLVRAQYLIEKLAKVPGALDGKNSGYFSVRCTKTGRLLLLAQVGECPPEKAEKYQALSLEKGLRLFTNKHHVSSWQSRNESAGQWGGAIVAGDLILSFSGLPELADEAIVLMTAHFFRFITISAAQQVATINTNTVYKALVDLVIID